VRATVKDGGVVAATPEPPPDLDREWQARHFGRVLVDQLDWRQRHLGAALVQQTDLLRHAPRRIPSGHAPRRPANVRRRGSRRSSATTRGPDEDGGSDPEPPGPAPGRLHVVHCVARQLPVRLRAGPLHACAPRARRGANHELSCDPSLWQLGVLSIGERWPIRKEPRP
jgi:hypothetical protein